MDMTFKELAKAGILFLVMGVAVYVLWNKSNAADERLTNEVNLLRLENKECTSTYQKLILEQLSITTKVIEENTKALQKKNK